MERQGVERYYKDREDSDQLKKIMHKDIRSGGTGTLSGLVSTMHVKT